MNDHMYENDLKQWLKRRKVDKVLAYLELFYVILLLLSLLYDFSMFMHLLLVQGIAIRFSRQLWNILFEMPFKFKLSDTAMNIMLYGDFAYVLILVGLAIGILAANKRFIRVASVITIFLAIVLLLAKSPLLITNILGMLVSLIGIWFSYRAKL
ncbi:hypothetical protein QFX17_05735 [Lactobacillus helveticus]|nr:hypothetical protein [Lactobacillus helveticus]MDN6023113.1 hypothetical protein [Lactobacillus sp.]MCO0807309.1 hypothetical protein [Lactobacillus helveticus]MCP9317260.1 hypothetical protein [Lactobacillus helveticus]MDH5817745.1 hypothetical protein [Lactobacillus helveticus]MDN6040033.1 hypothetical protein [Lactobacillus sp.]